MTKTNLESNSSKTNLQDEIERTDDSSKIKEKWTITLPNKLIPSLSWPEDVILFTPYEYFQMTLPELANCLTVQAFLRICKLDYKVKEIGNAEFMSPTFNIPFLKIGNEMVSELDGIMDFLQTRHFNLSDKLNVDQKINMQAYMSLGPNVMHLSELYMSWIHTETYKTVTSVKYGSTYPWPLNWMQTNRKRKQITKKLSLFNWSQKILGEVLLEFESCCEALSQRLDDKVQFFEGQDTELDACVFGHLQAILNSSLPGNYLYDIVNNFPDLLKFVKRIKMEYFHTDESICSSN